MSNTPLTDKEAFDITTGKPDIDGVVMADFARKLELELNEQVLLNGKGGEREYSLLGKIKRLERENTRLQMELDGSCNAEELRQVRAENAALREWVKEEGERMNVCTYDLLNEICENCKCVMRKEAQP